MNRKSARPLGPRKTLTDSVCERIRDDIVNGLLKPGEIISTGQIAKDLRTSSMPVRAALTRLEAEGLVLIAPQRGVMVSRISPEDLEEVLLIRSRLEGLAVYLASAHITKANLERLRELVQDMRRAEKAEDSKRWTRANEQFHRMILGTSQRPRLTRLVSDLLTAGKRGRIVPRNVPGHMRRRNAEHEDILNALECKDAELAEGMMRKHLLAAWKETANFIAEQERGGRS